MAQLEIERYTPAHKKEWDDFVDRSKNGTFLLQRDYMDYHADRFPDHSLMVRRDSKLYALLPVTAAGTVVYSHRGLTYGGLIMGPKATASEIIEAMAGICRRFQDEGYERMVYKPVPHIYHTIPAEEDLYALFRVGATLQSRLISCSVRMDSRLKLRDIRKSGIRNAIRHGITVTTSQDYDGFWEILTRNLDSKYGASPVHTASEIKLLAEKFPDNIRLHTAMLNGKPVAGVVMFLSREVAHAQYISASPGGKETGALDLLFSTLLDSEYKDFAYFDFGTSNEDDGKILNQQLIYQKEGFGGRAICYDTYNIQLK